MERPRLGWEDRGERRVRLKAARGRIARDAQDAAAPMPRNRRGPHNGSAMSCRQLFENVIQHIPISAAIAAAILYYPRYFDQLEPENQLPQ